MKAFDDHGFSKAGKERWGHTQAYKEYEEKGYSGLGQMYVADERFKNNIDKHAIGTAAFICQAIGAYCHK